MALVGILALQGGYQAHAEMLESLGHEVRFVRLPADLDGVRGIVLPGGESTTQRLLARRFELHQPLQTLVDAGTPVLATCAGLILAANKISEPDDKGWAWLDVHVQRNAWGRQVASFEAISDEGMPLMFIRAPRIIEFGDSCSVLVRLDGEAVAVRQGNVVGATFHPELTGDTSLHAAVFGAGSS